MFEFNIPTTRQYTIVGINCYCLPSIYIHFELNNSRFTRLNTDRVCVESVLKPSSNIVFLTNYFLERMRGNCFVKK